MNNVLLEMVAERAKTQGNPNLADLLARLQAPGADANQLYLEMIERMGEQDPILGQLAKRFAEAQRNRIIDVEPIEQSPEPEVPPLDDSAVSAIHELKEHAKNLYLEVQALRDRADRLAAALGACCLCWGEDPSCRVCRGRGAPGFALPDESLFEQFVLPAVMLLRDQKARARRFQNEVRQPPAQA